MKNPYLKVLQHLQLKVKTSFSNIPFCMPTCPYDWIHYKLQLLMHKNRSLSTLLLVTSTVGGRIGKVGENVKYSKNKIDPRKSNMQYEKVNWHLRVGKLKSILYKCVGQLENSLSVIWYLVAHIWSQADGISS